MNKQRIILFGASELGRHALNDLKNEYEIVCFLDNDKGKWGKSLEGIEIAPLHSLQKTGYDFILITSQYHLQIVKQLAKSEIPASQVKTYNIDFPEIIAPISDQESRPSPAEQEVLKVLVGEELANIPHWNSVPAERATITSLLQNIRPECAIEIGTYLGASLRIIHCYSQKIYSLDIDPSCETRLAKDLPKANFVIGPSQETLPTLLEEISSNPDHPELEFVFVDGDHTRKGVRDDINALMGYTPKKRLIILMHDVANPSCRQGMLEANWESNPYLHYVDLDFVPGILHYLTSSYREMWGGFGIAIMLPEKRTGPVEYANKLPQQYDALYQGSVHAQDGPNPFVETLQPFHVAKTKQPQFTACLPHYNHINVIPRAIDAMLSQSRPPDELLICDDASTDDSWEQLKELEKADPSIRLIRNQKNQGVVRTLNTLMEKAKGELLYFAGSDDYTLPLFFESILTSLERFPQAALGMASFYSISEKNETLSLNHVKRWTLPGYYSPQACLHDYFSVEGPHHSLSSATIYRKQELLSIGGFRIELGHWTDSFAIRALCLKNGCVYSPNPGAKFTCSANSFSGSQYRNIETSLSIINRAAELMRSKEFNNRFPESHVSNWKSRFHDLAQALFQQSVAKEEHP